MKKEIVFLLLIFSLFQQVLICNSNEENKISTLGGEKIYRSIEVNDPNKIHILDNKLINTDYSIIFQYVKTDNNLFLFGKNRSGEYQLSAFSKDDNKMIIIAKYSPQISWWINEAKFKVFCMKKIKISNFFILIEYISGNISVNGLYNEKTKCIKIYRYIDKNNYELINEKTWINTNILNFPNTEEKYKYLYLAPDDKKSPAIRIDSNIFLCDATNDGFTDILVWEKIYISPLIKDKDQYTFPLDREELHVMKFDNEKMKFLDLEQFP